MRDSVSIAVLGAGALVVAGAYALSFVGPSALAPWMLAAGGTLVLTGLGLLGAGPRAPRLRAAVLLACACAFVGFAFALGAAPPVAGGPLLFGIPRVTALMFIVSGVVPLILLPIAYAWAFPREVKPDA